MVHIRPLHNRDVRLKELYLNKEECVTDLPEWLLAPETILGYRDISRLAVVEMAGRDSVAAAIKSVEQEKFSDLLPTFVYTGTEYGPWSTVLGAVERLSKRLPETRIHNLVAMGSPDFWRALNGRFISDLMERYGFYTPCIGCHLYLHSIRIPLAINIGSVPIISGERERHNGNIKINQTAGALDFYKKLSKDFGIQLLLPLRHIQKGPHIEEILGSHWQEGEEQLGCTLSGNYRRLDSKYNIHSDQVQRYMEEF
ncbi:MAG: hypothetical protein V1751_02835, partial [Pseudomonadota bacterium]